MFENITNEIVENTADMSIEDKIKRYETEKKELESKIQELNVQQKVLENELQRLESTLKQELNLSDDIELTDDLLNKISTKIDNKIKELEEKLNNSQS